jgi:hypothetical protein
MSTQVKKVLKKKVVAQPVEIVAEPVTEVVEQQPEPVLNKSFIPSSRVHNYVSCHKLNKSFDDIINKIKSEGFESAVSFFSDEEISQIKSKFEESQSSNQEVNNLILRISNGEDSGSVLSDDDKRKVGEIISNMEQKNQNLPEGERLDINLADISKNVLSKKLVTMENIAVEIVSKKRFKFSKDSFDVLSAFSDMVVTEISKYALDRLVEVGNSTVEPKYVFSSEINNGQLWGYYSTLTSYKKYESRVKEAEKEKEEAKKAKKEANKKAKKEDNDQPSDTADVQVNNENNELVETEQSDDKHINFKFYVKSIIYSMKESDSKYANAKVSDKFQSLCSDIVLDILDDVVDLSQIILTVMSTKTISSKLFKACLFSKLYSLPGFQDFKSKFDNKF